MWVVGVYFISDEHALFFWSGTVSLFAEKENLCLYGLPNETWEINLPAEEVPPELPEPALGINFARDGMDEKDWLDNTDFPCTRLQSGVFFLPWRAALSSSSQGHSFFPDEHHHIRLHSGTNRLTWRAALVRGKYTMPDERHLRARVTWDFSFRYLHPLDLSPSCMHHLVLSPSCMHHLVLSPSWFFMHNLVLNRRVSSTGY